MVTAQMTTIDMFSVLQHYRVTEENQADLLAFMLQEKYWYLWKDPDTRVISAVCNIHPGDPGNFSLSLENLPVGSVICFA